MNNHIKVTRNRVYRTGLRIKDSDGYDYSLGEGEELLFGVKRYSYQEEYLLKKTLTANDYDASMLSYILYFGSEETDIEPGTYCYDIALKRKTGELERIIGWTPFEVLKSVVRSDEEC